MNAVSWRVMPGDVVRTEEGTRYTVTEVERGCTCPDYLDVIECGEDEAPRSREHLELVCRRQDRRGLYYLGGLIECADGCLWSVWWREKVEIIAHAAGAQLPLSLW